MRSLFASNVFRYTCAAVKNIQESSMSSNVSRRTFLRSAAATALVYSRGLAQAQQPVIVYVGCYTARGQGIYRYSMNSTTGQLTLLGVTGDQLNPSFLAIDPQQRFLY